MPEPTNEEIIKLLTEQRIASEVRERDRSTRDTVRDERNTEFQGEIRGALKSLDARQVNLEARITETDARFKEVEAVSNKNHRQAMLSIEVLESQVKPELDAIRTDMSNHNATVVDMLKEQNESARLKAQSEQDERNAERDAKSRAAAHTTEKIKATMPARLAWIGVVGIIATGVFNYLSTKAASEQTDRQFAKLHSDVAAISSAVTPTITSDYDRVTILTTAPAATSIPTTVIQGSLPPPVRGVKVSAPASTPQPATGASSRDH